MVAPTYISGGAVSLNDTIKVKLSCEAHTEAALSGNQTLHHKLVFKT